jgi:hypothetical protein
VSDLGRPDPQKHWWLTSKGDGPAPGRAPTTRHRPVTNPSPKRHKPCIDPGGRESNPIPVQAGDIRRARDPPRDCAFGAPHQPVGGCHAHSPSGEWAWRMSSALLGNVAQPPAYSAVAAATAAKAGSAGNWQWGEGGAPDREPAGGCHCCSAPQSRATVPRTGVAQNPTLPQPEHNRSTTAATRGCKSAINHHRSQRHATPYRTTLDLTWRDRSRRGGGRCRAVGRLPELKRGRGAMRSATGHMPHATDPTGKYPFASRQGPAINATAARFY